MQSPCSRHAQLETYSSKPAKRSSTAKTWTMRPQMSFAPVVHHNDGAGASPSDGARQPRSHNRARQAQAARAIVGVLG